MLDASKLRLKTGQGQKQKMQKYFLFTEVYRDKTNDLDISCKKRRAIERSFCKSDAKPGENPLTLKKWERGFIPPQWLLPPRFANSEIDVLDWGSVVPGDAYEYNSSNYEPSREAFL